MTARERSPNFPDFEEAARLGADLQAWCATQEGKDALRLLLAHNRHVSFGRTEVDGQVTEHVLDGYGPAMLKYRTDDPYGHLNDKHPAKRRQATFPELFIALLSSGRRDADDITRSSHNTLWTYGQIVDIAKEILWRDFDEMVASDGD